MSVQFPKVIDIDLAKSTYDEHHGNFYFKLDKQVEERWKQHFRDACQQEGADCFYTNQPTINENEWVVAYAEIEGENDLKTVLYHIKHAVAVANQELREIVDAEKAEEAKKKAARNELEQKVKRIAGGLDFN
ncbi:hypothetical protein [Pantoea sp. At-9b]|uniref:hypothetical protein n=1 Tax=Pantoea sp. (strain At-9b) TaxID=592316 RepID=UPI0001B3E514|nr:hypothetical protein [Pantoea sp. At-9b]ADU71542.1 hypothetical protein Pat9b_5385 [Pantoea sp. At-9b]